MVTKKITIEFTFEEKQDEWDKEYTYLELVSIERTRSDLSPDEIDALGEGIGQSDYWQVDRWIDIQAVLGASSTTSVRYDG
jgi:hypothetical protein